MATDSESDDALVQALQQWERNNLARLNALSRHRSRSRSQHRPQRPSRHQSLGRRRLRRQLNDSFPMRAYLSMSCDEAAISETEIEEEDEPLASFEWTGHFAQVGLPFFHGHNESALRRLEAERREQRAIRRKKRHERRFRKRAQRLHNQGLSAIVAPSKPTPEPSDVLSIPSPTSGSSPCTSPPTGPVTSSTSVAGHEKAMVCAAAYARRQERRTFEVKQDFIPSAPVARFYALIDRRIRRRLSALDQMDFVKDLERVLVMFKFDEFDVCKPAAVALESQLLSLIEPQSVQTLKHLPARALPLVLKCRDAHDRMLLHGLCQFHGLLSQSEDTAHGRVTMIRRPQSTRAKPKKGRKSRRAVFEEDKPHRHCLSTYLVELRAQA